MNKLIISKYDYVFFIIFWNEEKKNVIFITVSKLIKL